MLIKETLNPTDLPTKEQMEELEKAKSMPQTYDSENPFLTDAQLKEFKRIGAINHAERTKQTVSLRLSPQALRKAKSLGKGYTSVLSRLLEAALSDNDLIKRCM